MHRTILSMSLLLVMWCVRLPAQTPSPAKQTPPGVDAVVVTSVNNFLNAVRREDWRRLIDLTPSTRSLIEGIQGSNPKILWEKLIEEQVYAKPLACAPQMTTYLKTGNPFHEPSQCFPFLITTAFKWFPKSATWEVIETRGNRGFLKVRYASSSDQPLDRRPSDYYPEPKEHPLREAIFEISVEKGLVSGLFRVPSGDVAFPGRKENTGELSRIIGDLMNGYPDSPTLARIDELLALGTDINHVERAAIEGAVLSSVKDGNPKLIKLLKDKGVTFSSSLFEDTCLLGIAVGSMAAAAGLEPEQMRFSIIFFGLMDGQDEGKQRKAAEDVLAKIKAGGDFAALAKQYSEDKETGTKGGDWGFSSRAQIEGLGEDVAWQTPLGQTSAIVKTQLGFFIFKTTGRRAGGTRIPGGRAKEAGIREAIGLAMDYGATAHCRVSGDIAYYLVSLPPESDVTSALSALKFLRSKGIDLNDRKSPLGGWKPSGLNGQVSDETRSILAESIRTSTPGACIGNAPRPTTKLGEPSGWVCVAHNLLEKLLLESDAIQKKLEPVIAYLQSVR